jgi:hypothetical protein
LSSRRRDPTKGASFLFISKVLVIEIAGTPKRFPAGRKVGWEDGHSGAVARSARGRPDAHRGTESRIVFSLSCFSLAWLMYFLMV